MDSFAQLLGPTGRRGGTPYQSNYLFISFTHTILVPWYLFSFPAPKTKWLLRDRCVKPTCIGGGSGHIKNKKKGKRESELINNLVTLGKPSRGAAYSVVTSWRMSATALLI